MSRLLCRGSALAAIVLLAACSAAASNPTIPPSPSKSNTLVRGAALSGRTCRPRRVRGHSRASARGRPIRANAAAMRSSATTSR